MILIVAEKNSVGSAISAVVGADKSRKGYNEGGGYIVSWCAGHLVELKYPDDYGNGWDSAWSFLQLPMIPDKWQFKVLPKTSFQYNVLKSLMQREDVTEIICAADADREGECVFRYVYNMTGCRKPVKRLWVSSLEKSSIRRALQTMRPMSAYDDLFHAGFARAKADWLVGMNGSRLFSCRNGSNMSIGRVQTPTLAMIVKRDGDVRNFVKQKYFTADLKFSDVVFSSARIDNENDVDTIVSSCNGSTAVITSVESEVKTVNPPKLYDLTFLQRDANKVYGYTAQQTLDYTQSLYESKLITYPRTDSQYLTDDMKQTALNMVRLINILFHMNMEHTPDISRCVNNTKVTGHHAIIPTSGIMDTDLNGIPTGERNILKLIAYRLMCASAAPHQYEAIKVTAVCNNTEFTATGRVLIVNGWKQYEVRADNTEDLRAFPKFTEVQRFTACADKSEHFTSPPKLFTEDTLLSAMEHAGQNEYSDDSEKKGLGTPATRASIIEGLIKKGYVQRKGKKLSATDKGVSLVAGVPDEIKSARLTAEWEMKLQQIERGQYSADMFMREIENSIREMCSKYGSTYSAVSFSARSYAPIGKCPHCGGDVIGGKYGFYCKNKCGMVIAKIYGHELTENQITGLLSGKSVSYTANGKKNTVLPEVVENTYNGKTNYQWKVERSK